MTDEEHPGLVIARRIAAERAAQQRRAKGVVELDASPDDDPGEPDAMRPEPADDRAGIPLPSEPDGDEAPTEVNGHTVSPQREHAAAPALDLSEDPAMDGAEFILDQPPGVPAVWGRGTKVLWAVGEALMIAGPQGVGKSTLAGMLVRALLGLGDGQVLGLPVADVSCRVLYLAMDRPRQIARLMGRLFSEADRAVLTERLIVRPGPPVADLAARPELLAVMAEHYNAHAVFVDSLKDAAIGLSDDEVAARYNRARQTLLNTGRQMCDLHHPKKHTDKGEAPRSIDHIYGSTWLTSGCGSVVLLTGEPGDPLIGLRHVKQPADEVGPWQLTHDRVTGALSVTHAVDLVELVKSAGVDGLTAKAAAAALFDRTTPTRGEVEKARRKLDDLTADGLLHRMDGAKGGADGGRRAVWFLAARPITGDHEK